MQDKLDTALGYFAAALGFLTDCDFMALGAGVLLVARLVVDLPRAYFTVKGLFNGKGYR